MLSVPIETMLQWIESRSKGVLSILNEVLASEHDPRLMIIMEKQSSRTQTHLSDTYCLMQGCLL